MHAGPSILAMVRLAPFGMHTKSLFLPDLSQLEAFFER
jgi:hypothetical protein